MQPGTLLLLAVALTVILLGMPAIGTLVVIAAIAVGLYALIAPDKLVSGYSRNWDKGQRRLMRDVRHLERRFSRRRKEKPREIIIYEEPYEWNDGVSVRVIHRRAEWQPGCGITPPWEPLRLEGEDSYPRLGREDHG